MLGLLGCGRRMLNSHEGELTLIILNFSLKGKKPGMSGKIDYYTCDKIYMENSCIIVINTSDNREPLLSARTVLNSGQQLMFFLSKFSWESKWIL